ncbi:MAG: hypothetical protein HOE75_02775 [Chloroflexi bacterium]|nr:hypothetical protein [Chloroflexota bacterium]
MKQGLAFVVTSVLVVLTVACASTDRTMPVPDPPTIAPIPTPVPISFPEDEGLHDDRLEWWYYSGHLEDEQGDEYGFHFVIFQSLDSADDPNGQAPGYAAQFGLTDVGERAHLQDARFSTGEQPQVGPGLSGLRVADWTLSANPDRHAFNAMSGDTNLSLTMTPTKPPVFHNEIGWLAGPTNGWTYYYSRPRMAAQGSLQLDDRTLTVSGDVWMDHQWGEFFVLGNPAGWQWFGIQLDDGSELMVTQTRNVDGEIDSLYGSLIDPQGELTAISPGSDQIKLTTDGSWTSPHTGAEYPTGWQVEIPGENLVLKINTSVADQEITSTRPESAIYWEGTVSVSGTRVGKPVTGKGYVELTGYVVPPPLPWR